MRWILGSNWQKSVVVADNFIQYKGLTFSNSNHLFQGWLQKFRKLNHKRSQSKIKMEQFYKVYFLKKPYVGVEKVIL